MRYGMNLLLWTDVMHDEIRPVLEEIRETGYDTVELPVLDLDVKTFARWGRILDEMGLARTGVAVRGPEDNPISADPQIRRRGIECNKRALECARAAGCETLCGPMHSALGAFSGRGATADEWKRGVESMREAAEFAAETGVRLAVEFLNRFECYFLTSAAELARFLDDVDHPSCRAMYDTFHAHIEEKDVAAAIRTLGDRIVHVHISENDRSTPGSGAVRWKETSNALREIGYDGLLVVEAFSVTMEKLIPATKIWRRMYENERQLVRDALRFMKTRVA